MSHTAILDGIRQIEKMREQLHKEERKLTAMYVARFPKKAMKNGFLPRICSTESCGRDVVSKGMCARCYARAYYQSKKKNEVKVS